MGVPKYQDRKEYFLEVVKLKGWFLWNWLKAHPTEDFRDALRKRVDVFGKMPFRNPFPYNFDVPEWLELESTANDLYEKHKDDIDASRFEVEFLRIFESSLIERAKQIPIQNPFQCGSLQIKEPKQEWKTWIILHIPRNDLCPHSIFDDPQYLIDCLNCMIKTGREKYGADGFHTTTWLNSYPKWLWFFPNEYQDHMEEIEDIEFGLQFWGQFLNARGGFNHKHGKMMRDTGRFPYPTLYSHCQFEPLEKHLSLLSKK